MNITKKKVHKETIDKVPNAIKGRDNIELEICGMDNIPEEDLIEHERQKGNIVVTDTNDNEDGEEELPHKPTGQIHGPLPHMPPPIPTPFMNMMVPPSVAAAAAAAAHQQQHHQQQQQPPPPFILSTMPPPPHGVPIVPPHLMMTQVTQTASLPVMSQVYSNQPPPPPQQQPPSKHLQSQHQQHHHHHHQQPLFPAAANIESTNQIVVQQRNKIEAPASGTKIVHPDEDISLEEFRASHNKYKYIPPISQTIQLMAQPPRQQAPILHANPYNMSFYKNNGTVPSKY
jgi:hypothetical protein